MIKTCLVCGTEFKVRGKRRKLTAKYCSLACAQTKMREYFKGDPKVWWKPGHTPWNKGKKLPQFSGKNSPFWKGDKVGYQGVHHWINKEFGKPSQCDKCLTKNGIIEWANKTEEYKRDRSDWVRLCRGCHFKFDKQDLRGRDWHGRFL